MDYIPNSDAEFNKWFNNFAHYVCNHSYPQLNEDPAPWPGMSEYEVGKVWKAWIDWDAHYCVTIGAHTPGVTKEKNNARQRAEAVIRPFVTRFMHYEPVTDEDRINMRIPNHDKIRTQHVEVHETVEFEIKLRNIREIVVDFHVKGSSAKAKPANYDGAVFIWDVLDAPPHSHEQLTRHLLASRTPKEIEFDESERGKTVYVAAAWQNQRGNRGHWSEIRSAIIP